MEAERLIDKKELGKALDLMDKIVDLQQEHKFDLPEKFHFMCAQLAFSTGTLPAAAVFVDRYVAAFGSEGKFYYKALRLLFDTKKSGKGEQHSQKVWDLLDRVKQKSLQYKSKKVSFVRPVIGWGITRLIDDHVDFKEVGDRIFVENDSKNRSQFMTGGLVNLFDFKNKYTIDIAVNMEFAVGGKNVDGFFIGGGIGFARKFELVIGYSLGRGKELSHGFQRAMGRFIKKYKGDDKGFPELDSIELKNGVIDDLKDYDGLSLSYKEGEVTHQIFPGEPIVDSFNSKVSFGILIPLDVWKSIKNAAKNDK